MLCQQAHDIAFMDELSSPNMKHKAPLKDTAGVTYFFKYTTEQFLQVHRSIA